MLKVVIADDEERICRLVRMLPDWDALGMEVIGTAGNGLEALDLIESLNPDILITDIRMPGISGLELIERARKASPNLEIVLISGYAQFEYAQTAMRYDVGGYILKPIMQDVLTSTLEKLGKKCRERAASATAMEHLQINSDKSLNLLRGRLLEDLLNKRFKAQNNESLDSEYGFSVKSGSLQVFILKMDCSPEVFNDPSIAVIKKKVEEIFEAVVSSLCQSVVFQFFGSAGYGILNYEAQNRERIRHSLRHFLNQLEAQKPIFGAIDFSLAIGKRVELAGSLPYSLSEAQTAVAQRLVVGVWRLLDPVRSSEDSGLGKLLDKYKKEIESAVDTLNAEDAKKASYTLKAEAMQIHGVLGYELLELVLAAGKIFAMHIDTKTDELFNELEERCQLCGTADSLFGELCDFSSSHIRSLRKHLENEAIRPIRNAKQYIRQHFNEPITLEDVCAAIGFSTSYFSTMFKKETGEGFSKYLTRVRIEQAKALLQDTDLPVAEICARVGYNDLKHFTGTFKRMTSLNPGQYRKLYG